MLFLSRLFCGLLAFLRCLIHFRIISVDRSSCLCLTCFQIRFFCFLFAIRHSVKKGLYSLKLVNWHFWTATIGIVLYISAMWVSGILEGLMWRAYTKLGFLEYSFIETVAAKHSLYIIRALGGGLFLVGALIMAYNLWMTVRRVESAEPTGVASPAAVAAE